MTKQNKLIVGGILVALVVYYYYDQNKKKKELTDSKNTTVSTPLVSTEVPTSNISEADEQNKSLEFAGVKRKPISAQYFK